LPSPSTRIDPKDESANATNPAAASGSVVVVVEASGVVVVGASVVVVDGAAVAGGFVVADSSASLDVHAAATIARITPRVPSLRMVSPIRWVFHQYGDDRDPVLGCAARGSNVGFEEWFTVTPPTTNCRVSVASEIRRAKGTQCRREPDTHTEFQAG
jgi:hypothetical protein